MGRTWHERQLAVYLKRYGSFSRQRIRPAHVHAGDAAVRPLDSGRDQRRFIHWTAPPAAPLTRLSMTLMTTTVSSSQATPILASLDATTSFRRGVPSTTPTKSLSL